MIDLNREHLARELVLDRRRQAGRQRLVRSALGDIAETHAREVGRVRASVLLVAREPTDAGREV
jgi:hypothetical protein